MKKILILGAGLSSTSLIKYLLDRSQEFDWIVRLGDKDIATARRKIKGHERGEYFCFDVCDEDQRCREVEEADVTISMLPARFHPLIATECLRAGKHMLTASYVSNEIKAMDAEAREKDILMLNEIGVDPGIDHMSAMQIIDRIREEDGKLLSFESSTGGLVAPDYDNNPWNYKFTWNPRNVVLAGQGVSKFLQNGRYKYIPYHKLFKRTESASIPDVGDFEIYANRDSLLYREVYGLEDIKTLFRGTMRRPGYSEAWNVFVQLGMTDDTYQLADIENMTYRDFINTYLSFSDELSVEDKLVSYLGLDPDGEIMKKLKFTGIFDDEPIDMREGSPAQVLQKLLETKWQLEPEDKDMIAMLHVFEYEKDNIKKRLQSSLVVIGEDTENTAMAITVGIPVAIATKLLLTGEIKSRGVLVPIHAEIYEPVLKELADYGIRFIEREEEI